MRCKVELPPWGASGVEERRVCKCCGIVVCTVCCCKLVYEVFSRRVVKVCGHCYRESSRVRHPKETLENSNRTATIPIKEGGAVSMSTSEKVRNCEEQSDKLNYTILGHSAPRFRYNHH